jgi:ferredoxin-NADP reductase
MTFISKVIDKKIINSEILILRLERKELDFKAGQYIILKFPNEKEAREYSVYSGENDNYLDILLKTVPAGSFSKRLGELYVGDELEVDGPYGFFVMNPEEVSAKKHLFIATGTGISPFSSYIHTFPKLNYSLLHGIGLLNEKIEPENYNEKNIIYCVSRDASNHFKGRVTDYLKHAEIDKEVIYHLCGNSAMISDVSDMLEKNGISPRNIRTEAFY